LACSTLFSSCEAIFSSCICSLFKELSRFLELSRSLAREEAAESDEKLPKFVALDAVEVHSLSPNGNTEL
jgi:hypothetical protein